MWSGVREKWVQNVGGKEVFVINGWQSRDTILVNWWHLKILPIYAHFFFFSFLYFFLFILFFSLLPLSISFFFFLLLSLLLLLCTNSKELNLDSFSKSKSLFSLHSLLTFSFPLCLICYSRSPAPPNMISLNLSCRLIYIHIYTIHT